MPPHFKKAHPSLRRKQTHAFSPSLTQNMPCWAKTHTEDLPAQLINWGFASLFILMDSTALETLSKQNPLKSLYPTLQIHLFSIALLQFYPTFFGLFAVHLHWEFTIIPTHPSAQLSFSVLFTLSTISSCHAFSNTTLSSWPNYISMRKSLPSPLQVSMYCGNTEQMYAPFQRKDPFSETGMQWHKQTDSWLKWSWCQN